MSGETESKRRPRADGIRTREAILRAAVSLATVEGLEGLSIGDLAKALGMSKSGLYAHFGSKEELQLATVAEASRLFDADVVTPARQAPPGIGQILAYCDAYCAHLRMREFPGGCFFAGAAVEMGTRPGPVKQKIVEFQLGLNGMLVEFTTTAKELGQLPDGEDPGRLAFEIGGMMLSANVVSVLSGTSDPFDIAREIVRTRLTGART